MRSWAPHAALGCNWPMTNGPIRLSRNNAKSVAMPVLNVCGSSLQRLLIERYVAVAHGTSRECRHVFRGANITGQCTADASESLAICAGLIHDTKGYSDIIQGAIEGWGRNATENKTVPAGHGHHLKNSFILLGRASLIH